LVPYTIPAQLQPSCSMPRPAPLQTTAPACQRCHDNKTNCIRNSLNDSCNACKAAGETCVQWYYLNQPLRSPTSPSTSSAPSLSQSQSTFLTPDFYTRRRIPLGENPNRPLPWNYNATPGGSISRSVLATAPVLSYPEVTDTTTTTWSSFTSNDTTATRPSLTGNSNNNGNNDISQFISFSPLDLNTPHEATSPGSVFTDSASYLQYQSETSSTYTPGYTNHGSPEDTFSSSPAPAPASTGGDGRGSSGQDGEGEGEATTPVYVGSYLPYDWYRS